MGSRTGENRQANYRGLADANDAVDLLRDDYQALHARCVRAEEALELMREHLRRELKKARGVEMHDRTCSCNVCHWVNVLAAVPEKDKP